MSTDGPVPVRYRRPDAMQAWQLTTENVDQVARWCGGRPWSDGTMTVPSRDDPTFDVFADPGDWVIKHGERDVVVLEPEWFDKHYETIQKRDEGTVTRMFPHDSARYLCNRHPGWTHHPDRPDRCCTRA